MSTHTNFFLSPFLLPLVALAGGIYVQALLSTSWFVLTMFVCTSSALTLFLITYSQQRLLQASLCCIFFSVGGLMLQLQLSEFFQIRSHLVGKKLTLSGTITNKETLLEGKQCLWLMIEQFTDLTTNQSQEFSCFVQCYTNYPTNFLPGDQVVIENIAIPKNQNITRFPSFNDYLMRECIHASFFVHTKQQIHLKIRPSYSYTRWIWTLRENTYLRIKKKLSSCTTAFLGFLFLGKKKYKQTNSLRDLFNRWGLAHYLARSGLHIVLLIGIWSFLFSLVPINLWIKRFLLILISLIYAILSWTSVPFIRAVWIFALTSTGKLLWHHINILHLLCLVCLCMLLINPINLFFLDFQLTFGLTFTLILCNK